MRVIGIVVVVIAGIIGLSLGGLWFQAKISNWTGYQNQQIQINSSTNRTYQYEHFLQLFHTARTQALAADLARQERDRFEKVHPNAAADNYATSQQRGEMDSDVLGAEQVCMGTVNEYMTEKTNALRAKWVDSRLPDITVAVCHDASRLPGQLEGEEPIHY